MKVERPNYAKPTLEEEKNLQDLKRRIEQAIADGKLTKYELDAIEHKIYADRKVSIEELTLMRELIREKIQRGEVVMDWDM